MCINKVIEFTDFMSFYSKYKPLTPYGIEHKDSMPYYTSAEELDNVHLLTDKLIDLISSKENSALKIENHLSRIDRLNTLDKDVYDIIDIHLIKKFLIHFRSINTLLTNDIKETIGLNYDFDSVLHALTPDNDNGESFYLSSSFDEKLKAVRNNIAKLDTKLNVIRQTTLSQIQDQYQLNFSGREFVLVDKTREELLDAKELTCEFYDSHLIKVRPVYGKNYLSKQVEKEQLLINESEVEKKILNNLSNTIQQKKEQLTDAIESIRLLDVTMAKARLALKYKLTKPEYRSDNMMVKQGIYYPLWEKHQSKKLSYTPLNASFNSNTVLLSGSNMGGKTVLFRTLAFLQMLTQLGFRIPATEFNTKVYSAIHILGTASNNGIEGLSSFGQEIHQLTNVLKDHETRLLFVDELAKTTNATEAKAILYAV